MRIEIVIKNQLSQIRKDPSIAAVAVNVLGPSSTIYNATRMFRGWYYLEELKGWAESTDIQQIKVIDPYDPSVDYSVDYESVNMGGKTYIPDEIIDAINRATKRINCTKVVYIEDNIEHPIYGIITSLNQGLIDIQEAVNKIAKYPDIPMLPEGIHPGLILIENAEGMLEWRNMNYSDLIGTPELDPRYTNQF